jgi:hypothetical protein
MAFFAHHLIRRIRVIYLAVSASNLFMLVRCRAKPIAIIAAFVLMIAAIVYVALNRSHEVSPAAPLHQQR